MKAWYWCRMNGDDKAGTKTGTKERKSLEDVLQHSGWMVIAVCCSAVKPRKKKQTKKVLEIFSVNTYRVW